MRQVLTDQHRKTFPAIYSRKVTGLGHELDALASKYGWCEIIELGEIMRCIFRELGAGEWKDLSFGTNEDIFDRYGWLNVIDNAAAREPHVSWMQFNAIELYGNRPPAPTSPYGLEIPAGWVKKILKVVNHGVVRVTCVEAPRPEILVGDKPFVSRNFHGDVCENGVIREKAYKINHSAAGQLMLIDALTHKVTWINL